ncbi:MAG: porin family protein [Prevotella sp.]|jgi:hypothetical protein|nr:porin family protein [Prevotella sp.]
MKKILLLAVVLFASLNASAQWYIGGSVGFGSVKPSGGDSEAVFSILPELGYQLNDKWSVGAKVGYHKGDGIAAVINSTNTRVDLTEEFIIRPYARYSAFTWDPVTVFFDGGIRFASVVDQGTRFGLGVEPGVAVTLTDHITFVTHLGYVGFDTFSPKGGGGSSTRFGVDFSNNCSFGVYYNF